MEYRNSPTTLSWTLGVVKKRNSYEVLNTTSSGNEYEVSPVRCYRKQTACTVPTTREQMPRLTTCVYRARKSTINFKGRQSLAQASQLLEVPRRVCRNVSRWAVQPGLRRYCLFRTRHETTSAMTILLEHASGTGTLYWVRPIPWSLWSSILL